MERIMGDRKERTQVTKHHYCLMCKKVWGCRTEIEDKIKECCKCIFRTDRCEITDVAFLGYCPQC